MEELFAFLGFSAGAAVAIRVGNSLKRGVRSAAVDAVRAGLAIGDAAQRARTGLRGLVNEAAASARRKRE